MSKIDLKSASLPTLATAIVEGNTKRRHNASYLFQRKLEENQSLEDAVSAARILDSKLGVSDKEEIEAAVLSIFSAGYPIEGSSENYLLDRMLIKENSYQHTYFWNKRSKTIGTGIDTNPAYKIAYSDRVDKLPEFLNKLFTSKKDWSQFTRDLWNGWLYEKPGDGMPSAFSRMCTHIASTLQSTADEAWHTDSKRDMYIDNLSQFFEKTLTHYPVGDLSGLSAFSVNDMETILKNPYLTGEARAIIQSEFETARLNQETPAVQVPKPKSHRL